MSIIEDSIKININLLKEAESSGKCVDLHEWVDFILFLKVKNDGNKKKLKIKV